MGQDYSLGYIKGLMKLASSRERNQFQTLRFHSWVAVRMFSLCLNTYQGKHPRMKGKLAKSFTKLVQQPPSFDKQCLLSHSTTVFWLSQIYGLIYFVSLRSVFAVSSSGSFFFTWLKKFCLDNKCDIGDLLVFNLVGDGKTVPLLCVCPERKECAELLNKYLSRKSGK
ncbi:hypothetical protein Bca4012_057667 [Brassica carinata]